MCVTCLMCVQAAACARPRARQTREAEGTDPSEFAYLDLSLLERISGSREGAVSGNAVARSPVRRRQPLALQPIRRRGAAAGRRARRENSLFRDLDCDFSCFIFIRLIIT